MGRFGKVQFLKQEIAKPTYQNLEDLADKIKIDFDLEDNLVSAALKILYKGLPEDYKPIKVIKSGEILFYNCSSGIITAEDPIDFTTALEDHKIRKLQEKISENLEKGELQEYEEIEEEELEDLDEEQELFYDLVQEFQWP